jgi:hypothetical protein
MARRQRSTCHHPSGDEVPAGVATASPLGACSARLRELAAGNALAAGLACASGERNSPGAIPLTRPAGSPILLVGAGRSSKSRVLGWFSRDVA